MYEYAIATRTISEAFFGLPYRVEVRRSRWRWRAKLAVWWVNAMGAGHQYEYATYFGRARND